MLVVDNDSSASPAGVHRVGDSQTRRPQPICAGVIRHLIVMDVVGLVVARAYLPMSLPGQNCFVQHRLETWIEPAVDQEVADAVDDHEQVGEIRGADEPCRWEVVNSALEGIVDREKFVEIDQQARQICANKHAYDEDQYVGELKVLGLKYYHAMWRVQLFQSPALFLHFFAYIYYPFTLSNSRNWITSR